jgi:phage anti-repressor protein
MMEEYIIKNIKIPKTFIKDFFSIAKESYSDNEFIIDLEIIAKWLQVQKKHLKRLLVKNFKLDYDFTIEKIRVPNEKNITCVMIKEKILLTPDCFKELAMLSQTERAVLVCRYFLDLEKIVKKYHRIIEDNLKT